MNQGNVLQNYALSEYTIKKLDVIRERLKDDIDQADSSWQLIVRKKKQEEEEVEGEEDAIEEVKESLNGSNKSYGNSFLDKSNQFSSTQFYFTQLNKHFEKYVEQQHVAKSDITECLLEGLECPNGTLDLNHLENLTEEECGEVVCDLEKRLSSLGTYNLCCCLNNMNLEQRIKYASVFHTRLLLPKIVALEEPSRLLISALIECVQQFPDDIQKLIFIPLLNIDLKDTTIVDAMVNSFEPQRRIVLLSEYLSNVKELKSWHLSVLYTLISTKADITINDKLIRLLSEKAIEFAKSKNYGKLVLSFIKSSTKFSKEQKHLLWEIADNNETLFKRAIQNVLTAM